MITQLALALSLLQAPPPVDNTPIAIIFHDGMSIIPRADAERWWKSLDREKDWAKMAALEIALGVRSHHCDHTPNDNERECFDK